MIEMIEHAVVPVKLAAMSILATLSRIFYQKEDLTLNLFFARITMSTFVLWVAFTMLTSITIETQYISFPLDEDPAIVVAGALAFSFREVMDIMLFALGKSKNGGIKKN